MSTKHSFNQQRGLRACALSIGITFFLSACSDDNDPLVTTELPPNDDSVPGLIVTGLDDDPTGELTSSWLVNITLFRDNQETPATGSANVRLLQYSQDTKVSQHVEFFTPMLDTCEIRDLEGGGGGGGGGGNSPLTVSGGTSVTINTASGTWVDIPSTDPGEYEITDGFPGALPTDATLSIPGAQFPNVPAYQLIAPVDVPVRIAPASGALSAEDVAAPFTWEPRPNTPGGYLTISALAFDADGSFVGFPVICKVIDDGEFTMPSDVIEAFADTTLEVVARFERVLQRVDYINGIVFHQRSNLSD